MQRRIVMVIAAWACVMLCCSALAASSNDLAEVREAIKANGADWRAGTNAVSGLSPEEFAIIAGGLELDEWTWSEMPEWAGDRDKDDLPRALDWRYNPGDYTTPVKDQGNCGACAGFATCSIMESMIEIFYQDPNLSPDLSEAHVFFCGGGACMRGATSEEMLSYARENGVPDEACFPYTAGSTGQNQSCGSSCADWQERALGIIDFTRVMSDPQNIMSALQEGPLFAGLLIYLDFQLYTDGIYEHVWGPNIGAHAVEMVGYNADEQYWICKNSWTPGWGEAGYFRIRWGQAEIENWLYKVEFNGGIPCSRNTKPMLGPAHYYVGDLEIEQDPTVGKDEDFEVRIEFNDAECNLAGGDIMVDQGEGFERLIRLPQDAGCSSNEAYGPIVFEPEDMGIGEHTVKMRAEDRCEDQSETLELKYTVVEDPPDRGDDDDSGDDEGGDDDDDSGGCG